MHFLGPVPGHTLVLISFSCFCFRTPFPTPLFLPPCRFLFCPPRVPPYLPPLESLGAIINSRLQWQKEDLFIWFSCQNWGLESQEKEDDCSWVITKRKPSENSRTSTLKSSSSSPTVTFQRSRRIKQLLSSVIATQALWCPVSIHQNYKSHLHLQGYFTTKYKTDISFLLLMRD